MMSDGWIIVLDIGKSLAKATLWNEAGRCMAQRTRPNGRMNSGSRLTLDALQIEEWAKATLAEFAQIGPVTAIVPVAHGAGAALIFQGKLLQAPLDYEWEGFAARRAEYDTQRDPYAATGSPALPAGLNLGMQLHWLETSRTVDFDSVQIVPWAQYWAWVLSGVPASEFTSLGCHSDLWRPYDHRLSDLAVRRGWAERLAPLTHARTVLGTLTPAWVAATGLSPTVEVHCGMHDSNAALLGARSHPSLKRGDVTVLSTGTWFVAMRTPVPCAEPSPKQLSERRDCLLNVDIDGTPIPSARFMGGREIEILAGTDSFTDPTDATDSERMASAIAAVEAGEIIVPTYVPGVGPYPGHQARRTEGQLNPTDAMAAAHLYVAMVADVSLDLIGSTDTLLIEGRFASAPVFVQALANLRPTMHVLVSSDDHGVARGALQVAGLTPSPLCPPNRTEPLKVDMSAYRTRWRDAAERS